MIKFDKGEKIQLGLIIFLIIVGIVVIALSQILPNSPFAMLWLFQGSWALGIGISFTIMLIQMIKKSRKK